MANLHLVCEGEPGSIDERLLDRLVVQHHGLAVEIHSVGGDKGLNALRGYLDRPSRDGLLHNAAVSIQDRNYEPLARAEATWLLPGRKFLWRRHEIENYLLEPVVVLELFREFRRTVAAPWVNSLPNTEPEVSAMLQGLAGPLLPTHAACVLKEEAVRAINQAGELKFAPTPPPSRSEMGWLASLQTEAARLVNACNAVAALHDFTAAQISALRVTARQFQHPDFISSGDYLRDLDGHAFLSALKGHLHSQGAPARLSIDDLADNLIEAAERIYRPDVTCSPDDFATLAAVLNSLK